ncbi:MutS protein msh5 [Chytriomyces hyalinus]|nr:MutS protein msh5 [Chytriomyces hyalinus]
MNKNRIASISVSGSNVVAGAVLDTSEQLLTLMPDFVCQDALAACDAVMQFLLMMRPSTVVVNARSGEKVLKRLDEFEDAVVHVCPSSDFAYKTACNRLLSLHIDAAAHSSASVAFEGAHSNHQTRMRLYLETIASLQNAQMVGCAGALLSHVSKHVLQSGESGDDNDCDFNVASIEAFHLNSHMILNQDCYTSLNIFRNEKHPNMFSSDNKDGLSLFGLLNLTHSVQGKALLHQWFMRPSLQISIIRARQMAVSELMARKNKNVVDTLRDAVACISNIPRICMKLKKKLTVQEWEALLKCSFYCLKIRAASDQLTSAAAPIFEKIREFFDASLLKEVGGCINTVIDFELSSSETAVTVKHGVDQELDELKRSYNGLDDLLSRVAQEIAQTIPDSVSDALNVIYFPQLGYLITIPLREDMNSQESFMIPGLDFQFCTSKTVFYKSAQMIELDETLGDLHSIITDKEIEIVQRLQETILMHADALIQVSYICAELDCLLAFADAAEKYNFVCPTIVPDSYLEIVQGRHPLYEQCLEHFIGNNTCMGKGSASSASGKSVQSDDTSSSRASTAETDDDTSKDKDLKVMLLTGPNFSGKSVYLKQVGLIVFMAHIGSFVPAKHAVIGITDRILTRIQAVESDTKIQSAFMLDSQQMAYALRNSTGSSLVLIDEYGKGTLHSNGVGLFCASLVEFLRRQDDCPNVIATTHFHASQLEKATNPFTEIFAHNLLPETPALQQFKMDVFQGTVAEEEQLTFLYRIVPGNAGSSLGLYCARLAGISDSVLQRAKEWTHFLSSGSHLNKEDESRVNVAPQQQQQLHPSVDAVIKYFDSFDCEKGDIKALWDLVRFSEAHAD